MKEEHRENPFGALSFLDVGVRKLGDSYECRATIEFHGDEVPLSDEEAAEVGFSCAFLHVKPEGLRIAPESRYGVRLVPIAQKLETECVLERSATATDKASVEAGVDLALASIKAAATNGKEFALTEKQTVSEKIETEKVFVSTKGEHCWEFKPQGDNLDGVYANGDVLGVFNQVVGANQASLTFYISVRQRDMTYKRATSRIPFFKNKDRVMAIFVAKCLAKRIFPDESFNGTIVLSAVKFVDE